MKRKCRKCGKIKIANRENFAVARLGKLRKLCQICKREIDRKYHIEFRKNNKGYKTEEYRKYRKEHPEAVKAQRLLNYVLKTHKIKKSPCEVCGETLNIHGHHPDYSFPLRVMWLCPLHHKEIHMIKKLNKK